MPNRIIKESICTSEKVAALSDFEFRLWIGLITQADDAGRGDARAAVIKGRVFPLRDTVTIKSISGSLHALEHNGLIRLYTVGGKLIYCFPHWTEHQRVRDCKPKYPAPEEADELRQSAASCGELRQSAASCGELRQSAASCGELRQSAASCGELRQSAASCGELRQSAASCGELRQSAAICGLNPIQSRIQSESNPKYCAEPEPVSAPAVITLLLNDGTKYGISDADIAEWAKLYPAVDVMQELRNMAGWCEANPKKRKTRTGIRAFVNKWLAQEQNAGGRPQSRGRAKPVYGCNQTSGPSQAELEEMQRFLAEISEG